MASADAVVRLLLNTSDFDSKLVKSKRGMKDLESGGLSASSVLKGMASTVGKVAGALGLATSAMKVLSDAFMSNETNVDNWGRTVASAQGLYENFVTSLNNQDLSSFFDHINDIVQASEDAYNALDKLGTHSTMRPVEQTEIQTKIDKQKYIIRQYGKDSPEGKKAQQAIKQYAEDYKKTIEEEGRENLDIFRTQVTQKLGGMKLTSAQKNELWASFGSVAGYEKMASKARGERKEVWKSAGGAGSYKTTSDTRNFEQKMGDLFTDEWRAKWTPYYQAYKEAGKQAVDLDLSNTRYTKPSTTHTSTSHTSTKATGPTWTDDPTTLQQMADNISLLESKIKTLDTTTEDYTARVNNLGKAQKEYNDELQRQKDLMNWSNGKIAKSADMGLGTDLNKFNKEHLTLPEGTGELSDKAQKNLQQLQKSGQVVKDSWQDAVGAISQVGSALQSVDDKNLNAMGVVIQAICNIALAFSEAVAQESARGGIWGMIGAVAGGMASMITAISAIHNATGYAEGGVVGGNSYSGDRLYARLNSGEVVLNQEQIARANNALDGRGGGASYISGEQIVSVINAYGRRTRKGEILK